MKVLSVAPKRDALSQQNVAHVQRGLNVKERGRELTEMENKERELLKSYQTLLNHVEKCSICRKKMVEILQHMIDIAKKQSSREALEMLREKSACSKKS